VGAFGADKDKKFEVRPVEAYANRQIVENLAVAAETFITDEQTRTAFGKLNPNRYGILPILVVMQNQGKETLSLEDMRVEYHLPTRQRLEAIPARDVPRIHGADRPKLTPNPLPIPTSPRTSTRKNPLAVWEIEGRAFAARVLPPGESASGFFYFQTPHRAGSVLYITGIREASSHRELFFIEIPLDK